MPVESVRTLWGVLEVVRPAFTPASFSLLVVLFRGRVLAGPRHALTDCLLAAGVAGRRDHTAFYRFFARGTWNPDALGRLVFHALLARLAPDVRVDLVVDDTLARHKGPHLFGLGCHLDAVRSSRKTKVFTFGHVWVVLDLVVPLPLTRRGFALPILFRLYRSEKQCAATGATFRKKTDLAREMLDLVVGWLTPPEGTTARRVLLVPFVGMVFSLLGLWHLQSPVVSLALTRTDRPWYRTKETVAFSDILQVARNCLRARDFRDLAAERTRRPSPQLSFAFATPTAGSVAA